MYLEEAIFMRACSFACSPMPLSRYRLIFDAVRLSIHIRFKGTMASALDKRWGSTAASRCPIAASAPLTASAVRRKFSARELILSVVGFALVSSVQGAME